jgi:hypothetical protein
MFAKRRWRSIRFRIVLIYFLLVFIAMTVIGVFITDQLEAYQMELIRSNFTKIVQESVISLQEYEHLNQHREEIQADIQSWAESLREEMFVVDDGFVIIASSNSNYIDRSALDKESTVVGDIRAKSVTIDGKVKGSLVLEDSACFQKDAVLIGDVTAGSISMSEGAQIIGSLQINTSQVPHIELTELEDIEL